MTLAVRVEEEEEENHGIYGKKNGNYGKRTGRKGFHPSAFSVISVLLSVCSVFLFFFIPQLPISAEYPDPRAGKFRWKEMSQTLQQELQLARASAGTRYTLRLRTLCLTNS
jgi:hypothetical protein